MTGLANWQKQDNEVELFLIGQGRWSLILLQGDKEMIRRGSDSILNCICGNCWQESLSLCEATQNSGTAFSPRLLLQITREENLKSPSENHSWFSLPARLGVSPRVAFFFIINFVRICNGLIGESSGLVEGGTLCIRKQQIWRSDVQQACWLLALPPKHSNSSCCVHWENMTAADIQRRHKWSHPLCLAASANPLFTAFLCRHPVARDTGSKEIWLCSLGTPLSSCVVKFCSHGGGNTS